MNKKTITILIIILVTASIAGAFWFFQKDANNVIPAKAGIFQKDDVKTVNKANSDKQEKIETVKEDGELNFDEVDTSDWKTYRNEEYGFGVKYPKNWIVKEGVKYPAMNVPGVRFTVEDVSFNIVSVIFAKNQRDFSSMIQGISCENEKCTASELKKNVTALCGVENSKNNISIFNISGKEAYGCVFVNELLGDDASKKIILVQNTDNNFYVIEYSTAIEENVCNMFVNNFVFL